MPVPIEDISSAARLIDRTALRAIAAEIRRHRWIDPADADDLRQELALCLLDRIDRFDPRRGQWSTFCRMVARHALRDWLKRRPRPVESLYQPQCDQRGVSYVPADRVGVDDAVESLGRHDRDAHEWADLDADWESAIAALPAELQRVCRIYLQTGSMSATADSLGISRATVYRRCRRVRRLLADHPIRHYRSRGGAQ